MSNLHFSKLLFLTLATTLKVSDLCLRFGNGKYISEMKNLLNPKFMSSISVVGCLFVRKILEIFIQNISHETQKAQFANIDRKSQINFHIDSREFFFPTTIVADKTENEREE
jgi:hypothetical protein